MDGPAKSKRDVLAAIEESRDRIRSLGVKRIGLFGSFVHDRPDPDSDVDLLVEFGKDEKTFDNFMRLSFLLEDLLKRRVELVTTEALSPYIGPHILKEVEYAHLAS